MSEKEVLKKRREKHEVWIQDCKFTPEQLAEQMGNLYYDALSDYLCLLSRKILQDSQADRDRNRLKLANCLARASEDLANASKEINAAWKICAPFEQK